MADIPNSNQYRNKNFIRAQDANARTQRTSAANRPPPDDRAGFPVGGLVFAGLLFVIWLLSR